MAGDAHVGVLLAELHFPANRSLKDKRQPLSSACATRCSGATGRRSPRSGGQDSWQLAEVLVVLAASSGRQASERIDEIDRYLHGRDFEVSRVFVKSVDPVEDLWDTGS